MLAKVQSVPTLQAVSVVMAAPVSISMTCETSGLRRTCCDALHVFMKHHERFFKDATLKKNVSWCFVSNCQRKGNAPTAVAHCLSSFLHGRHQEDFTFLSISGNCGNCDKTAYYGCKRFHAGPSIRFILSTKVPCMISSTWAQAWVLLGSFSDHLLLRFVLAGWFSA